MAAPGATAGAVGLTPENSRQQASLRDFLNQRMAPFLKRAIRQSLVDDPDYPLRYLGEHLINQSLQYESNPQKPEIKSHFQYNFDRPAAPAVAEPTAQATSVEAVTNGIRTSSIDQSHSNGVAEEAKPIVPAPAQDTEMEGAS